MEREELLRLLTEYVENNIGNFHAARLKKIESINLKEVLETKNPYLFKAKALTFVGDLVKVLVDATMSSSEETIFGGWLEGLAIYVNGLVYGGKESGAHGIDLEFTKDGVMYFVAIKSGPNWANGDQTKKMIINFQTIQRRFANRGTQTRVEYVNGCCYGYDSTPRKDPKDGGLGYWKLCGQKFWEFISGDPDLYVDIIEPLGHRAEEKNEEYRVSYGQALNKIEDAFKEEFYDKEKGTINWEKIIKLNSQHRLSRSELSVIRKKEQARVKAEKAAEKLRLKEEKERNKKPSTRRRKTNISPDADIMAARPGVVVRPNPDDE